MFEEDNDLHYGTEVTGRIETNQIVKYAGLILTGALAVSSIGLNVVEAKTDHTKEICPLTSFFTSIDDPKMSNIGINHQISGIEDDYEKEGISANVYYNAENNTFVTTKIENKSGYSVPSGYVLENVNGKLLGKKETKEYVSPISKVDEDGNLIYVAPDGYTLETKADGTLTCVKTIVEYIDPKYNENVEQSIDELKLR